MSPLIVVKPRLVVKCSSRLCSNSRNTFVRWTDSETILAAARVSGQIVQRFDRGPRQQNQELDLKEKVGCSSFLFKNNTLCVKSNKVQAYSVLDLSQRECFKILSVKRAITVENTCDVKKIESQYMPAQITPVAISVTERRKGRRERKEMAFVRASW